MDADLHAPDRTGLLDRVFHRSLVGMVVAGLDDGVVVEVNEAFCALVGRPIGEVLGADVDALGLWGELGPAAARGLLLSTGLIDGYDTTVAAADDETRIIRVWAEVMDAGAPMVVIRASDVDGRAAAKSRYFEMRETEIRYRALVEQIPAIIYTQVEDPSSPTGFRDTFVSPQTNSMLGYTPEEWRADPTLWIKATHPDDADRVVAEDRESVDAEAPFRSEYRMITRDGRTVWIKDEAVLVQDPATGVRFWLGVMMDMSEIHEAVDQQAETQAKYRALVEQLPAVVYLGEYGEQGDWLYISPQVERVFGYTPREWLEHPGPMATFVHADDLPHVREQEELSLTTGEPFRAEYRMQRRDGTWLWVLDEASIVRDARGTPICMQGLLYDITERKEAEQRLVALDRLKHTLLHTLSHDLKEPLTAILGAASTLERLDAELEPEERGALLRTLVDRTKGMNALLTDLLDLDRLDQGIAEPRRFPVDLDFVVRQLVARCGALHGHHVHVDSERCLISVDVPKVERMVENLLANAARHTRKGSNVWVRVKHHDAGATIVVEDDGPGVPDELREQIFEPFRRGPGQLQPGSGIGLSLVARFAELHGGHAWVEERAGGGASFRVFLPA
jgi:PAS domain S-box-containing protein